MAETVQDALGREINRLRTAADLSPEGLAHLVGVSPHLILGLEDGSWPPSTDLLGKISDALKDQGATIEGLTSLLPPPQPEFDFGELWGMRLGGADLIASSVLGFYAWYADGAREPFAGGASAVDGWLGLQMLLKHHSWRAWAMLRAAVGAVFAIWLALQSRSVAVQQGPRVLLAALAMLALSGSVLLFLVGKPSRLRLIVGSVLVAAWLPLVVASLRLSTP